MVNQAIVDILVKRISSRGINPVTGQPIKLEDIKIQEYRDAVEAILNTQFSESITSKD